MRNHSSIAMVTTLLTAVFLSRAPVTPAVAGSATSDPIRNATAAIVQACADAGGSPTACGGDFAAAWAAAIRLDFSTYAGSITDAACETTPGVPSCTLQAGDQRIQGPGSASDVATGIADFAVGDSFGGGHGILGRTLSGDWLPWVGGNGTILEPFDLPQDAMVCAGGDGLTLRDGPSTDAARLAVLADNTRVRVEQFVLTDPANSGVPAAGWYRVSAPQAGWLFSKYLVNARLSDAGLSPCSVR